MAFENGNGKIAPWALWMLLMIPEIKTPIIFVGGKGGVGKTTLSASIASKLAKEKKKTLIVSTDPAHSLGDALDIKLASKPKKITPFLDAMELDAYEVTEKHFKGIEETLQGYADPRMFGKIKEHLELAKESPGAQEAAILESICKLITMQDKYEHIVFDTAPTGHTIRLLSLPSIMSAWTEGLMRHQREQEKIKNAAEVFWEKKKDYKFNPFKPSKKNRWDRALEKMEARRELFLQTSKTLIDPSKTSIYLVMIPQILPLEETKRAVNALKKFSIKCAGIFVNQIIPKEQESDFWQTQVSKQGEILDKIEKFLKDQQRFYVYLSPRDLRGVGELENIEFTPVPMH